MRALGMCSAADATDLNGWLVSQGHALAYRRYSTKYVPEEDQAKALCKDRTHEVGAICQTLHISRSTLYRYLALPDG